jgi:hypothetical protein
MIYLFLKHSHSIVRWFVLALLIYSAIVAAKRIIANERYMRRDKIFNMLTTYFAHLQLLLGIILYFVSSKVVFSMNSMHNPILRFFLIEHVAGMLVAIVLITIGYSQSKKVKFDKSKNIRIFIYFVLALVFLVISIPWPWNNLGAGIY